PRPQVRPLSAPPFSNRAPALLISVRRRLACPATADVRAVASLGAPTVGADFAWLGRVLAVGSFAQGRLSTKTGRITGILCGGLGAGVGSGRAGVPVGVAQRLG